MTSSLSQIPSQPARETLPDAEEVRAVLGFVLGSESYALPLGCVQEILRVPPITAVPRAAHDILGVISVRGQVTTLVDLRRRLSLPCGPLTTKSRVLLVEHSGETIGLLCDRVHDVVRLQDHEVEMASVLGAQASSHVAGIARPAAGPMLILLESNALLKRLGHA